MTEYTATYNDCGRYESETACSLPDLADALALAGYEGGNVPVRDDRGFVVGYVRAGFFVSR